VKADVVSRTLGGEDGGGSEGIGAAADEERGAEDFFQAKGLVDSDGGFVGLGFLNEGINNGGESGSGSAGPEESGRFGKTDLENAIDDDGQSHGGEPEGDRETQGVEELTKCKLALDEGDVAV
jgi:hypothetical protein